MEYKCKRCKKEFKSYDALRRHVGRIHKVNSIDFYVEFNLNGEWPTCKCGCGGKMNWSHVLKRFVDFCQGHQSRIHNNWGHNQKAIDKSAETRRKQFESGERKMWNDSLTKDLDERVKLNGIERSKAYTEEIKKEYSERMRQNRLNGIVPTLYGPDSSQWKGGVSEINVLARNNKRLYDEWKYPILVRDGFKCVKCQSSDNLHVHHDREPMCEIVKKHIVDEEPKEFELKKIIAEKVVDYHIRNKVSGITLCGKCHGELHLSLNFSYYL